MKIIEDLEKDEITLDKDGVKTVIPMSSPTVDYWQEQAVYAVIAELNRLNSRLTERLGFE